MLSQRKAKADICPRLCHYLPMSKDDHIATPQRRAAAWAVHAFTTSGVVLGFLALVSILEGDRQAAFLWLGLALFVDGIDGSLARRVNVEAVTPYFDGRTLDNIIDFFTYVIVPAMMVYWFGLVPQGWEIVSAALILAVSCYTFANLKLKTHDWYFSGFPALWNVVVLYFYLLGTGAWLNLSVIFLLSFLTFVPVKVVHPLRVPDLRPLTVLMTVIWGASTLRLVLLSDKPAEPATVTFWLCMGSTLYFIGLSLWRTVRPALS